MFYCEIYVWIYEVKPNLLRIFVKDCTISLPSSEILLRSDWRRFERIGWRFSWWSLSAGAADVIATISAGDGSDSIWDKDEASNEEWMGVATEVDELAELLMLCLRAEELSEEWAWGVEVAPGLLLLLLSWLLFWVFVGGLTCSGLVWCAFLLALNCCFLPLPFLLGLLPWRRPMM